MFFEISLRATCLVRQESSQSLAVVSATNKVVRSIALCLSEILLKQNLPLFVQDKL